MTALGPRGLFPRLMVVAFVVVACSAIGSLNVDVDELESTPLPSRFVEPEETSLHTDEPLPTYLKSPPASPDRSPWQVADCVDWERQVDSVTRIQPLARITPTIAIGTFGGYENPRWNTPDGEKPSTEEFLAADY